MALGSLLAAARGNEVNKRTAVSGQGTNASLYFCSLGSLYESTKGTSGPQRSSKGRGAYNTLRETGEIVSLVPLDHRPLFLTDIE